MNPQRPLCLSGDFIMTLSEYSENVVTLHPPKLATLPRLEVQYSKPHRSLK